MVIEKLYSSYERLNKIVTENIPEWMTVIERVQTINLNSQLCKYTSYRAIRPDGSWVGIYLYDDTDYPTGSGRHPAITIGAVNKNTNVDILLASGWGTGVDSSEKNNSNNLYSGKVRLVITEHAFGISLLNTNNDICTGAVIVRHNSTDDDQHMVLLGTTCTSTSYMYYLNALGLIDTRRRLSCIARTYGTFDTIIPYCDWAHGFTEPYEDVYISVTRSSAAPVILTDGKNTYYRITATGDYDSPPIYIKDNGE